MAQPIAALRDNFTDNLIAAAWTTVVTGSATATETSGQARCTLPSSTAGTHLAYFRSAVAYDLSSASWYINIETMVATGVAATASFELFLDGNNKLIWRQLSNTITARTVVNGTDTQQFTATWSASTYKYLRIRNSGTDILFESSTNGTSWTTRATVALSGLFAITALFIQFGASCGNIASPGSLRLDDVNLILPALSTNWNWTQVRWPVDVVHRNVTMAIDAAGTGQGYVVTADGVDVANAPTGNVRYFSGPASDGRLLTEQTTEAAAQAMAVNIPLDGRFDLPELVQCRCVRVGHRSIDAAAYTIRELYPRRLVRADDIEAEAIRALHIAAEQIIGSHISAVFDITSKRIQTAYSLARVVLSGEAFGGFIGYSDADTYDPVTGTGTYQVLWKLTDGEFYFGGGSGVLNASGIELVAGTASIAGFGTERSYRIAHTDGDVLRSFANRTVADGRQGIIEVVQGSSTDNANLSVRTLALSGTTKTAIVSLAAGNSAYESDLILNSNATGAHVTIIADDTTIQSGLNVGSASGATTGQVLAIAEDAGTTNVLDLAAFAHGSSGTPADGFGGNLRLNLETSTTANQPAAVFQVTWATAAHATRKARLGIFAYDTAAREGFRVEASGSAAMIGFLGATAVVRQTVGAAAPAGGTGATAGAYDTAANRNAMITLLNNIRTAGINLGLWQA